MVAKRHPKDQVRIRDWSHAAIWQRARAVPRPNALVAVAYTQLTLVRRVSWSSKCGTRISTPETISWAVRAAPRRPPPQMV